MHKNLAMALTWGVESRDCLANSTLTARIPALRPDWVNCICWTKLLSYPNLATWKCLRGQPGMNFMYTAIPLDCW